MAVMKNFPVINMKATGANIMKLRKSSGYSVADFQSYFNFDAPQAIYKWQRGDSIPSTDNLLALSYLLEVPIEQILVYQTSGNSISPQEKSCGDHLFIASLKPADIPDLPDNHLCIVFNREIIIHADIWYMKALKRAIRQLNLIGA